MEKEKLEAGFKNHDLDGRGAEVSPPIKFSRYRVASSTMQSHRLIHYVSQKHSFEKVEELYAILNHCHHEEGRPLNDETMLIEAATQVGLEKTEVATFLKGTEGKEDILRKVREVHDSGIHSIPTFIIDNPNGRPYVISGAQRKEIFVNCFEKIEAAL